MASPGYTVSQVPNKDLSEQVYRVRVTIHTLGPVIQGAQLSQNHWTIELLLKDNRAARLDMTLNNPASATDLRGKLKFSVLSYQLSQKYVNYFDYQASENATVGHFIKSILENCRERYEMTDTGVGCRHWISVVIKDWQDAGLILARTTQGRKTEDYIHLNWSKGQAPIYLEIKEGKFY